jgi:hypothetical protein
MAGHVAADRPLVWGDAKWNFQMDETKLRTSLGFVLVADVTGHG